MHCFVKDHTGKRHFDHDYSAVVYAHSDGKLLFGSFRAFNQPFNLKLALYKDGNPLPSVQAVNNKKPTIINISEVVYLFKKKKETFEVIAKQRKQLEYNITKN